MTKVLVVDDERTTVSVIKKALESSGYEVIAFTDPRAAVDAFRQEKTDLVISDYFMPRMSGAEFLAELRSYSADCPFIFLTGNSDLQLAIELVKSGADDYITKPIVVEELVFRVEKCIEDVRRRRLLAQIQQERELIKLENHKLVNWRQLYASKDIRQTEQMIRQLSQAINQAGGYLWLDLLKSEIGESSGKNYCISPEVAEMVLETAASQKQIFDYITFIGDIDHIDLNIGDFKIADLMSEIVSFCREEMEGCLNSYNRGIAVGVPGSVPAGRVRIDKAYLKKILHELLVNSIKFSPDESRIVLSIDVVSGLHEPRLEITIQNVAKESDALDTAGNKIFGIPYDYSEMVFDLFYTIDQYPVEIPEEEWKNGTGLYVARKLLKRQGAWIRTGNGTDHTGDSPTPVVRVTITIPLLK
ncbi:ATP-binding response regulator [Spirochaeta dissipatitropha]